MASTHVLVVVADSVRYSVPVGADFNIAAHDFGLFFHTPGGSFLISEIQSRVIETPSPAHLV